MEDYQRRAGERLRELREARNWTLLRAAQELKTTQETVGAWERNEHVPRPSSWEKIERVYGVKAEEIRGEPPVDQMARIEAKLDRLLEAVGVIESAADEALLPSLDDAPPPPTGEAPGEGETLAAESG